jgi:uncharacterized membrane protein YqjE
MFIGVEINGFKITYVFVVGDKAFAKKPRRIPPIVSAMFSMFKKRNNLFQSDAEERRSIVKNVLLISVGFTLLFTGYGAMAKLQSSINQV